MFKKLSLLLAVIAAAVASTATAHAGSPLTFVSATGTNNSDCSVTSPCQTFAQALAVTTTGGEINCLTPGGFSAVTISISVTIDCEGPSNGGIQVSSGNAITIATADIIVNLIGLDLNGENASTIGVEISAAATVTIRNCKIHGFGTATSSSSGAGINIVPSTSGGTLVVDNVLVGNNGFGIGVAIPSGVVANMTVRNSTINNNGIGVNITNGGAHAGATIEQTTLAFNVGAGLLVSSSGAVAVLGGLTVVNNGTGVATQNGGTIYSFKNNQIGGNGTDGTPLTAYPGGPLN